MRRAGGGTSRAEQCSGVMAPLFSLLALDPGLDDTGYISSETVWSVLDMTVRSKHVSHLHL